MKKLLLTLVVALTSICASAITMDDVCGVYTRHMDNRNAVGGMGAAQVRDITITITAKDANTVVLSGMLTDNFPIEGTVDFEAKTISFDHQTVGINGEIPYIFANSWGGVPDGEPVVGRIGDDGVITLGDEDEAYAGFYFSIPEAGITMFNMYGIITLTKDPTMRWFTEATYKLGEGENISGTSTLVCCNSELTGYDFRMELPTYWGSYTLYIKAGEFYEGITYDVFIHHPATEESEATCNEDEYLWWMKWYDYEHWSEYLHLNSGCLVGGTTTPYIAGDAQNGTILLSGEYAVFTAESEEALEAEGIEPVLYERDWLTIVWGDGGPKPNFHSIASLNGTSTDGAIYNLAGQRVEKPTRGLFIRDGKKYLVK